MSRINGSVSFGEQLLSELRDMKFNKEVQNKVAEGPGEAKSGESFMEHLKDSVAEVNQSQRNADKMAADLSTGKSQNIHETMLAATQSELSFNFMVQVRNKVLEAYQEVMRMPI